MAGTIMNRLRHIYLRFVGAPPDEATQKETADITSRLQGVRFDEPPEDQEEGEKLAKLLGAKGKDDSLAGTVFNARPRNPFDD
jgi:hypothetical protein